MKKLLFIDRDGTLVIEPPIDYQLDSLEKLEFYPKVMRNLGFIRSKLDFDFVMVTDNVPFWLKVTDMFLYSIYILLFVTVVAIIASGIKKKLS